MGEPEDLVSLEEVATRLAIPRQTLRRKLAEWRLDVYENPLDRRQKLVSWADVQAATKPRRVSGSEEGKAAA